MLERCGLQIQKHVNEPLAYQVEQPARHNGKLFQEILQVGPVRATASSFGRSNDVYSDRRSPSPQRRSVV